MSATTTPSLFPSIAAPPNPTGPAERSSLARVPARKTSWIASNRGVLLSLIPVYILVVLLGGAAAVALFGATQPAASVSGDALPAAAAGDWLIDNASPAQRVVVDQTMVDALTRAGWSADDVFTYGSDGAAEQPASWRDVAYVVTGARAAVGASAPELAEAVDNSIPVASFGSGDSALQVRRVTPEGASLAALSSEQSARTRTDFGSQLAQNPAVQLAATDRALLTSGMVDARITAVLGTLAAQGDVVVAGFPVVDGEQGQPLRQVAITSIGGAGLVESGAISPAASALLDGLGGEYAPRGISVDGADVVLRYALESTP